MLEPNGTGANAPCASDRARRSWPRHPSSGRLGWCCCHLRSVRSSFGDTRTNERRWVTLSTRAGFMGSRSRSRVVVSIAVARRRLRAAPEEHLRVGFRSCRAHRRSEVLPSRHVDAGRAGWTSAAAGLEPSRPNSSVRGNARGPGGGRQRRRPGVLDREQRGFGPSRAHSPKLLRAVKRARIRSVPWARRLVRRAAWPPPAGDAAARGSSEIGPVVGARWWSKGWRDRNRRILPRPLGVVDSHATTLHRATRWSGVVG